MGLYSDVKQKLIRGNFFKLNFVYNKSVENIQLPYYSRGESIC